jgi:hypothetical protein
VRSVREPGEADEREKIVKRAAMNTIKAIRKQQEQLFWAPRETGFLAGRPRRAEPSRTLQAGGQEHLAMAHRAGALPYPSQQHLRQCQSGILGSVVVAHGGI